MQVIAEDLRKAYGDVTALDGLSLEIPAGTTFGVLGTNGAGKSTLFRLIVGLDSPDGGRLLVGDRPVSDATRRRREDIGYLPERVGFPSALTGREVLTFHARMRGLTPDDRIPSVLETVGLSTGAADRPVGGYSNGMRRRLGLAAALLAEPRLLVLDEPTAGLDPRGVAEFHRTINRVRTSADATVLLASHALSEIERLCGHVAIVHEGRIASAGRIGELVGGDDATVRLRPAAPEEVDAVLAVVEDVAAGEATTTGWTITVNCRPHAIPSLLAALDGRAEISDVTVERAGLEAAFHEAIPGEVST